MKLRYRILEEEKMFNSKTRKAEGNFQWKGNSSVEKNFWKLSVDKAGMSGLFSADYLSFNWEWQREACDFWQKTVFSAECEYLAIENWEKRNKKLYKIIFSGYNRASLWGKRAGGVDNLWIECWLRVSAS